MRSKPSKELQEFILQNYTYEPITGIITRKGETIALGGSYRSNGYRDIGFFFNGKGTSQLFHRAAWLLHYGEFPECGIDHIDGNKSNNKIYNLRLCTSSQNSANRRKQKNASLTSIYKGVSLRAGKHRKPWRASINCNGKAIFIGQFGTEIEAAKAYDNKAREFFGEFSLVNLDDDGFGTPRSERYFLDLI